MRINEGRDHGEIDRYAFYDDTKPIFAAPPDVLRVDEKNVREYYIPNLVGGIITTNYKTNGIYLPPDDRRHYVAWSYAVEEEFEKEYWIGIWRWYDEGGDAAVAYYLANLDLTGFDAKAPPPKTNAFWEIVNASQSPENAELADVLDGLGRPDAVTLDMVKKRASIGFAEWLGERKNTKVIPHRFEECAYEPVRNRDAKDGLWRISNRRIAVYAKRELSLRDRIEAARALTPSPELDLRPPADEPGDPGFP